MRKGNLIRMATKTTLLVSTAILIVAFSHIAMAQTTHVVGDALGWTIPADGSLAYNNWSTNQSFAKGDSLLFNFMPGAHDVMQVTKSEFETCNTSHPISVHSTSPAEIRLDTEGNQYFICSFRGHCLAGQKLMVNVANTGPAPSPYYTNSPTLSVSASLGANAAFFPALTAILVALFIY